MIDGYGRTVICHQDVSKDWPAVASGDAVGQRPPVVTVGVGANDVYPVDTTIGDVIDATGNFNPQSIMDSLIRSGQVLRAGLPNHWMLLA